MEKKKIVFIHESLLESIITDMFTFLCLAILFELNRCYIQSGWLEVLIIFMFFCVFIYLGGKTEMTPREAYEFLKLRFEDEDKKHAMPEQKVQRQDNDGDTKK